MDAPGTFGEYVKVARTQQDRSLKSLAKQLGRPTTTISRVEKGIVVPQPDLFVALVDALHLDVIVGAQLIEPYRQLYERIIAQQGRSKDHDH